MLGSRGVCELVNGGELGELVKGCNMGERSEPG
jgi:hypothetical protein